MLVGKDNLSAIRFFDQARLLMPQSLVEEAALRREIGIVDPARSADKLLLLCDRYSASYRGSPFARQFWAELSNIAARAPTQFYNGRRLSLAAIVEKAPAAVQTGINIAILRNLVMGGDVKQAVWQLAKTTAAPGTPAASRISLYSALVEILSGRMQEGAQAARAIDPAALPSEDIEARDMFLSFSAPTAPFDEQGRNASSLASAAAELDSAILSEGERALVSSQAVLRKAFRP